MIHLILLLFLPLVVGCVTYYIDRCVIVAVVYGACMDASYLILIVAGKI